MITGEMAIAILKRERKNELESLASWKDGTCSAKEATRNPDGSYTNVDITDRMIESCKDNIEAKSMAINAIKNLAVSVSTINSIKEECEFCIRNEKGRARAFANHLLYLLEIDNDQQEV